MKEENTSCMALKRCHFSYILKKKKRDWRVNCTLLSTNTINNLAKSTVLCSEFGCSRLTPPPEFDALVSRLCSGLSVRARALLNMASDGMILTNHDHQIRVGILTGKYEMTLALFTPRRSCWSVRTCCCPLLIVVPVVIPIWASSAHLSLAFLDSFAKSCAFIYLYILVLIYIHMR